MELKDVIAELEQVANPEKIHFKREKYGVIANNSLGVMQKELKEIAKKIGKDDALAIELFDSGIYECRILTSKVYNYRNLTEKQMEEWVSTFENWEITDSFCMDFFARSELAYKKIFEWAKRDEEFVKRSAFAMIAAYSSKHKNLENKIFESFFPLIIEASTDERNFVKKAVNWALRSIGKRNEDLLNSALEVARQIKMIDSKSARWIANHAIRELSSPNVTIQDHPRKIYRPQ